MVNTIVPTSHAGERVDGGPGFEVIGDGEPASPVVMSVPHAGQVYPASLLAALRLPSATLTMLEDRHVDRIARAARHGETLMIQQRARAWIDLNRGEDERDPLVDEGADRSAPVTQSLKLRSGLGLVPRRAGRAGDLWRRRFSDAEVRARLASDYHPYHAAIAQLLARAHARFGTAVLLDLHSMPPLGGDSPRVVLGDRFGRSAAARFVARAEAAMVPAGWKTALNSPYAGGNILSRHGRPAAGIHAIQVELDRSLYLDARLREPGDGFAATVAAVSRLAEALADEAIGRRLAAE